MSVKRVLILLGVLVIVVLSPASQVQTSRASDGWYAEYFSNQSLAGWPAHTWTDRWIGFDWGLDAPKPGLSSEYFSIRWTRSWSLKSNGVYQFCAIVDDGGRIFVDGVLVLDLWYSGDGLTHCGSQYKFNKGEHEIVVQYYENGGQAKIYMWWEEVEAIVPFVAAVPPKKPATTTPSLEDAAPAPLEGWQGEYFGNMTLSGRPDMIRLDPWIGFEWGKGSPFDGGNGEWFSVRWRRSAWFEEGYYRFCAMSDDGVRIWVDSELLVDEWHGSNGLAYCGSRFMTEGIHQAHVEYYENLGNALIYVWWERDLPRRVE